VSVVRLPTGTVTFLLTDVEGSTALWEDAAEAMRSALARHDLLFEQAIRDHGGTHIRPRGEGDSRFAVFESAPDAISAALAIQRAFAAEPWPTPRPIKVRIGIHTGEAELRDGDYYGSAVNRCARLRGLGHGGQILLSEATAALVRDQLSDGVSLSNLGAHRLRDLARPEQVTQLAAADLPASFPPLSSPDTRPNNLPIQTTSLLGREREVAQIRELLLRDGARLVTLTGPGGTGKTRLALHGAADLVDRFADGVFFVDLAPVSDPSLIATTIAPVLGVAESGERLVDDLKRFLQQRALLLVLDNFEQLLAGSSVVADLLAASAGLKILVTSRAALQVRGEQQIEVPPLAVPDLSQTSTQAPSVEALQQYPAVALFVERAQAVRPDFALTPENGQAVAAICARLDGLPLALELAAARVRLLPPEAMARRLEQSLPLLTGGARDLPARQRTLRDTIAWSYDLLSEPEQRLFRWLSVFVGGFTLEAAAAICEATPSEGSGAAPPIEVLEGVDSLIGHSLVRQREELAGEPRFTMLETIREFGLERLEASGEAASVRDRHLAWCINLTEQIEAHSGGSTHAAWLRRFDAENDNYRAALQWATSPDCDPERALRLAGLLRNIWSVRGQHREGRAWLARILARSSARTAARASALEADGYLAVRQNDHAKAEPSLEEALAIWRERGDRAAVGRTLRYLALVPLQLREHDRARALLNESLAIARQAGDRRAIPLALRFVADLAYDTAEYAEATAAYEQTVVVSREMGNNHELAYGLRGLGNVARARGEYARARELLREALRLLASLRDQRCTPICLEGLACTEVGTGWAERAVRMFAAARALQETTGAPASPSEMADYQRTEIDAHAQLGEERFAAIWSAGAAMSLDEAVGYALVDDEPASQPETASLPAGADGLSPVMAPSRPSPAQAEHSANVPLSVREREVVALIAQGLSNREIADALVLSVRTVERHIENVYNRLGISGRAGRAIVTAYALRHGVSTPNP